MEVMKTPGVHILEKEAFPHSVVQVDTAVPVFIGYTQKAVNGHQPLKNKPTKITSMAEYIQYFGGAPDYTFTLSTVTNSTDPHDFIVSGVGYTVDRSDKVFIFYNAIRLFYQNGGGMCYIISVGDYSASSIDLKSLVDDVIPVLKKEAEPTLVVIPELMSVDASQKANVPVKQGLILNHCGEMQNRFAILDIYGNDKDNFRSHITSNSLMYGAAYYPWINTTVVQPSEVSLRNIDQASTLVTILKNELQIKDNSKLDDLVNTIDATIKAATSTAATPQAIAAERTLHNNLLTLSPVYQTIIWAMQKKLNLLPPSAAIAGIYAQVDNNRGVWKAPANVALGATVSPAVNISSEEQEDLNIPIDGKAVNAIRAFAGEGPIVWGARTLDGNSQDWRYINVRRTAIMIEQSVKAAAKAYVFEPNDANTWIMVKSMIDNFLHGLWRQGGLAGAKPVDAFTVQAGLGQTMTYDDILNGILRVTVLVALSHPAEFIEITFEQQMQKS